MSTDQAITLVAAGLAFAGVGCRNDCLGLQRKVVPFHCSALVGEKADAYGRIIQALADLVYYHEEYLTAVEESRSVPDALKSDIDEHWRRGYSEIKKATAVGAFMISADAEAALQRMWQETNKAAPSHNWMDEVAAHYEAVQVCLKSVVAAAKSDLQKSGW